MRAATIAAVFAVLSGGCARTHLFYDTRELRHAPLQPGQERALVQTLEGRLDGRRVTWVDKDGREHAVATNAKGLAKLEVAELGALWMATSTGDVGGENDVRVRVAKGSFAVSVYTALDGSVRVVSPREGRKRPTERALGEEEIRERFNLDGKLPGNWEEAERRALTESLESLTPKELAIVRSISFDRKAQSPDGDASRAALYELAGCRASIFVFSTAVRADRFRFVGDAADPRSAVLHSIVHEIGHAFEQAPARAKYCAAEKASGARRNSLIEEGIALSESSPALAEYTRVLAGQPAPTDYGNSSAHESFAESFALFHVDPDALERTRPKVFAWFKAGGHL